jgi:DNA (cytosine-5)-methyltransferase 1
VNELHLFAGAGGGILGGELLGHRCVCAVEIDPYCRSVLVARQNDGSLPPFPIWDDIRTFDGNPWRGVVDVVAGGFPCQDISVAGGGAGIDGERSGLWVEMARVIREVRPSFVFVENSPALVARGLGRVLGDLAAMGFDAEWGVIGAGHLGAWHLRERIWIVASDNKQERIPRVRAKSLSRQHRIPWRQDVRRIEDLQGRRDIPDALVCGVRNGVADYVDRISAIGNGQVPRVAATAWRMLVGE